MSANKELAAYVVKHIDATANLDDLDQITVNVKKQCPKWQKKLCKIVQDAVEKASK